MYLASRVSPESLALEKTDTGNRVVSCSGSFPETQVSPIYFDRTDVKKAIHAPVNETWIECSNTNVFEAAGRGGDQSLPPAVNGVLANVVEKSERAVIVHGLADFILIAEG